MDLEELRAFLAVAEMGSYLAAASALGVARTTLRRKVDALEARVGVRLLEGTRTGVVLTDAGAALAVHGRRVNQEMHAVVDAIRESVAEPDGKLRLVLPVGLPPHLLVPMFTVLRAGLPRLRLHARFSEDPTRERLEDVDVVVHFGDGSPGPAWVSFVVRRIPERLVASPRYLAEHGTPRVVGDLARHELLVWQAPGADPRTLPTPDGRAVDVVARAVSTDIHVLRQCCIAGLGIAYLPDADLPDPGLDEPLVAVLTRAIGRTQTVRLSVPRALEAVPKIRLMLDRMRAFFDR